MSGWPISCPWPFSRLSPVGSGPIGFPVGERNNQQIAFVFPRPLEKNRIFPFIDMELTQFV
jgi:hypothetical protein